MALYTPSGNPVANSAGTSSLMRDEFNLIQAATDVLEVISLTFPRMTDANTSTEVSYIVPSFPGTITTVYVTPHVNNSVTDTIIGMNIATVAVGWSAAPTVPLAGTAGTTYTGTANATNVFAAGDQLELTTDGGGTVSPMPCDVTILVTRALT